MLSRRMCLLFRPILERGDEIRLGSGLGIGSWAGWWFGSGEGISSGSELGSSYRLPVIPVGVSVRVLAPELDGGDVV